MGGIAIIIAKGILRFHAVKFVDPFTKKEDNAPTVNGFKLSELIKINGVNNSFHQ